MSSSNMRRAILDNSVWLAVSVMFAVIVWITATLASDPVVERAFRERVPIQVLVDDDMIVTNAPTNRAFVVLRAQESIFEVMSVDDIQIVVDLRGSTALGRVTVPLTANVARQASVVTISPSQIVVELQQRQERLVPVRVDIVQSPPVSVQVGRPTLGASQVLVSGPEEAVQQVDVARLSLDLSDQRESYTGELRLVPIDVDGAVVNNVTLVPDTVSLAIDIQPRNDVREVRVSPNLVGQPPEGYTLTADFQYSPDVIFVSGDPLVLETLPGTLFTTPIDLSTHTDDFQVNVPVVLPDDTLVLLTGQQINVSVAIDPIPANRQFEAVPVEVIGLGLNLRATTNPAEVTVLVNGPQALLGALEAGDVRVIVNASDVIGPGRVQLSVEPLVGNGSIASEDISVLPATVDVEVEVADPTATPQG
ncbi:MAG: YbbR-like domain-containing protein [Phototrophicaceae bacterium]|jgi:YbbR domain-containing protein